MRKSGGDEISRMMGSICYVLQAAQHDNGRFSSLNRYSFQSSTSSNKYRDTSTRAIPWRTLVSTISYTGLLPMLVFLLSHANPIVGTPSLPVIFHVAGMHLPPSKRCSWARYKPRPGGSYLRRLL